MPSPLTTYSLGRRTLFVCDQKWVVNFGGGTSTAHLAPGGLTFATVTSTVQGREDGFWGSDVQYI